MNKITERFLITERGNLRYLEELRELSRINRKNQTKTEAIVWYQILDNKKTGFKFLRQKPINRFIIDFYSRKLLLAIEIDGGYHKKRINYDNERDKYLDNLNIKTIRFTNEEVLNDLNKIKEEIMTVIKERKTSLR